MEGGENNALNNGDKPIRNPHVVLREEFDDWAILFNPDAGLGFSGFGLNPTGVCLWKLLDGKLPIHGLIEELRNHVQNVPEDASNDIKVFVDALVAGGLVGYGDTGSYQEKSSHASLAGLGKVTPFIYEAPRLVNLNSSQAAIGKTCTPHGSQAAYCCSGASASASCGGGSCFGYCTNGNGDSTCCGTGTCVSVGYGACCETGGCGTDKSGGSGCNCGTCALSCYGGSTARYVLSCTTGNCNG